MTLAAVKSFSHQHLREALPPSLLPELLPLIAEYGLVPEIARLFNKETLPLLQNLFGEDSSLETLLNTYFYMPPKEVSGRVFTFDDMRENGEFQKVVRYVRRTQSDIFYGIAWAWQYPQGFARMVAYVPEPLTTTYPFYIAEEVALHDTQFRKVSIRLESSVKTLIQRACKKSPCSPIRLQRPFDLDFLEWRPWSSYKFPVEVTLGDTNHYEYCETLDDQWRDVALTQLFPKQASPLAITLQTGAS